MSDEVRTVSSTGGEKGVKLARFDLLPATPLRQVAEHFGRGAQKYEDRNWERGYEWSKSYGALQRHANAFWSGEDIDEETGSPHMAAVVFHALALLEFARTHPDFDDRPMLPWESDLVNAPYVNLFPKQTPVDPIAVQAIPRECGDPDCDWSGSRD